MKLERVIKTTYTVECPMDKPVFNFGDFRDTREKHGTMKQYFRTCFMCKKKFEDGDGVYLAAVSGTGNRLVCEKCNQKVREGEQA